MNLMSIKKPMKNRLKLLHKPWLKTIEGNSDLISNKVANTSLQLNIETTSETLEKPAEIPKERYISTEKRETVIHKLTLI